MWSATSPHPSALPGTFDWFSDYWGIPIVGPLIGGLVGVLVYDLIISPVVKARAEIGEPPKEGRAPEPRA